MSRAVPCVLLAGLCGCASAHWANDKGETAPQQVISDCTFLASARASSEGLMNGTYVSTQGNAGAMTGRTELPRSQVPTANTGIQEQTYFNVCMKQKGYELVRVPPAESH